MVELSDLTFCVTFSASKFFLAHRMELNITIFHGALQRAL